MINIFEMRQYGNFKCSCGCGQVLGRATNGTDMETIEHTICIADDRDDEGLEWRCFKPECFGRAFAAFCEYGKPMKTVEKLYRLFPAAEEVF